MAVMTSTVLSLAQAKQFIPRCKRIDDIERKQYRKHPLLACRCPYIPAEAMCKKMGDEARLLQPVEVVEKVISSAMNNGKA